MKGKRESESESERVRVREKKRERERESEREKRERERSPFVDKAAEAPLMAGLSSQSPIIIPSLLLL
jgi:hypothetical protein